MGSILCVRRAALALAFVASLAPLVRAQKKPDVRLDTSTAVGASVSSALQIAAAGENVYVAWIEGPTDVRVNRSRNGGSTWLPSDVPVHSGSVRCLDCRIAAVGSSVYVTWRTFGPSSGDVFFSRSLDAGATWSPAARLNVGIAPGTLQVSPPVLAAVGSSVWVAWSDLRTGCYQVYLNRSLDGGATWLSSEKDLGFAGCEAEAQPEIAASTSGVHVVWIEDIGDASSVVYNRSLDEGTTWLSSPTRLDVDGVNFAREARVTVEGASVFAVWRDERAGSANIYCNRSLDSGDNWLANDVRLDVGTPAGANPSFDARVVATPDGVYAAWVGFRSSSIHVYFNRSLDQGATWLANEFQLDIQGPPGPISTDGVRLAAAGLDVHAVWSDPRNSENSIYFNRSLDGGTTWLDVGVPLNVGSPPVANADGPEIAHDASSTYVAWTEVRGGTKTDVYFNLALGYQRYGEAGTPGTGGLVPRLAGSGPASIGSTSVIDIAGGRGGALCLLVYGFTGRAAIASRFGPLLVAPPWGSVAVTLSGAAGAPGAGSATVAGAIPYDVSLIGQQVDFQATVFDPAATRGIALSRGLELWIL